MPRHLMALSMSMLLAMAAQVALAAPGSGIEWTTRLPNGELTQVEIKPLAGGESVQIVTTVRPEKNKPPVSARKKFGKAILVELQKAWGPGGFDIAAWPWEMDCDRQVSWKVTSGGSTKVVCRDKTAVEKMGELQSQVQAMMGGGGT